MEVLRFGPGHRREPPLGGGRGVAEQAIWDDQGVRVTELAFGPRAVLAPRSSPRQGLFVIVAGGGWVQVGEERTAVNHGEAVVWPPHVAHGAWTDGSHMRALLIEVSEGAHGAGLVHEGTATTVARDLAAGHAASAESGAVSPARGRLAEPPGRPEEHDSAEGEPW